MNSPSEGKKVTTAPEVPVFRRAVVRSLSPVEQQLADALQGIGKIRITDEGAPA